MILSLNGIWEEDNLYPLPLIQASITLPRSITYKRKFHKQSAWSDRQIFVCDKYIVLFR